MQMYTISINMIGVTLLLLLITFSLTENYTYLLASIDAPNVIIDNVHTAPPIIHIGDYFILNATVKNISNDTIDILNFGCKGPIEVLFYNNVEVVPITSGICFNPQQIISLKPGESVMLSAPDFAEDYKASSEGIVDAILQLEYSIQNDNQTTTRALAENRSNYAWLFSKPFVFEILSTLNNSNNNNSNIYS
jgi:hypothetical protein